MLCLPPRRLPAAIVLFVLTALSVWTFAAEKTFSLSGVPLRLEEVTGDVDVRYQSMRLNRALNVWNVEVTLTPRSGRTLRGPLLLLIDQFSGTSGPLLTDGADDSPAPKYFYDFSNWLPQGRLHPGAPSLPRTLSLGLTTGAPRLATRVYASPAGEHLAALTRSLNQAGQPLPGVHVTETGPLGQRTYQTDAPLALVTLGHGAGTYLWKFQTPDYLPVWRASALPAPESTEVSLIDNPRLTRRSTNTINVAAAAGGQAATADRSIRITFGPNAFPQDATVTLTPLTPQTLPALLPRGWSPLQAFWFEGTVEPVTPVPVSLRLSDALRLGETAAWVRLDTNLVQWSVVQLMPGNGANLVTTSLTGSGAYALVVPDVGTIAPPPAQIGQPLLASATPMPDVRLLSAGGSVDPRTAAASRIAELVTARASVAISNQSEPLPSGIVLRCDIAENYRLRDGTRRIPPRYESFLIGYQRPGDNDPATLHADFPVRPQLLLGAEELERASVTVDVLSPAAFDGVIVPASGGQFVDGDTRFIIGTNAIADGGRLASASLRPLNPTNFVSFVAGGVSIERGFELTLTGGDSQRRFAAQFNGLPTNSIFVFAKLISGHGFAGVEPRERLVSDAQGRLVSAEPPTGDRLPGMAGPGQYLLLRLSAPQAFISGVARNSAGEAAADLPVRIAPWLTFSAAGGEFRLLAPLGANEVSVSDPGTGDTGQTTVVVSDPASTVRAEPSTHAVGPRVVSVHPTNNATGVARVSPIVIHFSKPVNPGALVLPGAVQILATNGQPISASVSPNLQNTILTLLPASPLAPSALHTVTLSTNIADLTGRKLEGPNTFTFTTETDAIDRLQTAQVVSYEPVNGRAAMTGSPGIAEPESPVILVNETTGRTSTILSKPDGSFTNSIEAGVDDFLSAVIVNRNGTRNTIPQSRQIFRDGSVGLFGAGGTIEEAGEHGTVEVVVEPGTIPNKTMFKVEPLTLTNLLTVVSNTQPEQGKVLGGFKFTAQGDSLKQSLDVAFPINPADVVVPEGARPEDAAFVLAVAQQVDGGVSYQVIDTMQYSNGKLVTHSPPYPGFLGDGGNYGLSVLGSVSVFFPDALAEHMLMTALQMGLSQGGTTVSGRVLSAEVDDNDEPVAGTEKVLPGARVTVSPLGQPIRPGRIRPGTVFSTSKADGSYAILAPSFLAVSGSPSTNGSQQLARNDIALHATHPKFPNKNAFRRAALPTLGDQNFGQIEIPGWDLIFERDTNDVTAPGLHVSHTPAYPAPGTAASLRVVATDDGVLENPEVAVIGIESGQPGASIPFTAVTLQQISQEDVGGFGKRAVYSVSYTNQGRVRLFIKALDASGNERTCDHIIFFGGAPPGGSNPIPPSDPNDNTGPYVIFSSPASGSKSLAPGQPIVLRFNEAIDRGIFEDASTIQLTPTAGAPSVGLSSDQHELTLFYHGLQPNTAYALSVGTGVRDLSANPLDQQPLLEGANSFVLSFSTAQTIAADLTGIQSGGGAVIKGAYAYVLERTGDLDGGVFVYDLSTPSTPQKVAELGVPGYPRDLALIPSYSFKRRPELGVETKDLLAVVGGKVGAPTQGGQVGLGVGQYLWIIDISDPLAPKRVAGTAVNFLPFVAATKVLWRPPYVSFLEIGGVPNIGVVNVQSFIFGLNLTAEEFLALPAEGTPGKDNNLDGDFVDPGDELPLPASRSREVAGKITSFALPDTDQFITDFDFSASRSVDFVGVTLENGHLLAPGGGPSVQEVPAGYRTLYKSGIIPDRVTGFFAITNGRPHRVSALLGYPFLVNTQPSFLDVVMISVNAEPGGTNRLVVLDITDPTETKLMTEIPLPETQGQALFSVSQPDDRLLQLLPAEWASSPGRVQLFLATSRDLIVLDPAQFVAPVSDPSQPHPAVTGVIRGAGNGAQKIASLSGGLTVSSLGGRNSLNISAPALAFVSFQGTSVIDPEALIDAADSITAAFEQAHVPTALFPSRFRNVGGAASTLSPPHPSTHYHVLVQAPGSTGAEITLLLESLNSFGQALKNKGKGFAPVRAANLQTAVALQQEPQQGRDAPISALTAYRLSSDKSHANYNLYLSRPFALTYERMSIGEVAQLKQQLRREIIWSGSYLRASLDPAMNTNAAIGVFTSSIDGAQKVILPGAAAVAETLPAGYIMGPNPPAIAGFATVPGTFGAVAAHNGEFRSDTVDIVLPGRRLEIEFVRTVTGQDLYDGPFGRSWDFNYNQHLVEIKPAVFPASSRIPLVVRGEQNSEIASTNDVLFHTGRGRKIVFKFAGTNPPPEYATDPLASQLGWLHAGNSFYLPQEGAFDMLVRFADGKFARLTPDGTQFWYSPKGRLEVIYDRYPKNKITFSYNERGELLRIQDRSVTSPRFLDIGYWRLQTDSFFRAGVDEHTSNARAADKICRLKDYTHRDILFYYTDAGLLERREGPLISTAHAEGFTGRPITRYLWDTSFDDIKGIVAGSADGTPVLTAQLDNSDGVPVISETAGPAGTNILALQHENTAASLATGEGKSIITAPDGAITELKVDKLGLPAEIKVTGPTAPPATTTLMHNDMGLVTQTTQPEGNSEIRVYDTTNPNLRARANLLSVTHLPGPRGGDVLQRTFSYDLRYNLLAGPSTDFNSNTITYELTPDGRDIKSITYGDAGKNSFAYNEFGQVVAETTVEGVEATFTYDSGTGFKLEDRRGSITIAYGYAGVVGSRGLQTSITPPEGNPQTQAFDEKDQLITISRGGAVDKLSFDEHGNMVRLSRTISPTQELIETRKYTQIGFLQEATTAQVEVDGGTENLTTRFEPDELLRIKKVTFPNGETREHQFDSLGRLIRMRLGDYIEDRSYDLNGNLLSVSRGNATNIFVYDGHDRPISTKAPSAGGHDEISQTYYGNGEVKSILIRGPDYGTVLEAHVDELDALGRNKLVRVMSDRAGPVVSTQAYDPIQRSITITTPRNEATTVRYDQAGRGISRTDSVAEATFEIDGSDNLRKSISREGTNTYTVSYSYNGLEQLTSIADDLGIRDTFVPRIDGAIERIIDALGNEVLQEFTALGELQSTTRPNGVSSRFRFSAHRDPSAVVDKANQGRTYEFDSTFRLNKVTYRDGSVAQYSQFDARGRPQRVDIPGGHLQFQYDLQGRMTNQLVNYNGVRSESFSYDAFGRVRRATSGGNMIAFDYDRMGPLLRATSTLNGQVYEVRYDIYPDGAGKALEYPSGISVSLERENNGRLLSVIPSLGDPILSDTQYEAADIVRQRRLGTNIVERNAYDLRKRLLARRYERLADGKLLAEVRYVYDPTDNRLARQFVHQNGRTDLFSYDAGSRLQRADIGARPFIPQALARDMPGFTIPNGVAANLQPGLFARSYLFDTAEDLDLLVESPVVNPDNLPLPLFATNRAAPDQLLFQARIDGFDRGAPDPLGNAQKSVLWVRPVGALAPQRVEATLTNNGLSQLISILRADGVLLEFDYQPDGLRSYRKISRDGAVLSETAFIYDGDLLIEEWDRSAGANLLIARYFYDDDDVPVAADFVDTGGVPNRYYFLTDALGSVMAIADATGRIIERVSYDPWGQPAFARNDQAPPRISRIISKGGDLVIEFTEPVLPPLTDTAPGTSLATTFSSIANATAVQGGSPIEGAVSYVESLPGSPFGTVVRFHPASPIANQTPLSVLTQTGGLVDGWNNAMVGESVNIVFDQSEGALLYVGAASGSTSAEAMGRSSIGSPILFHGQYFDYDSGLLYVRARFYDPATGLFLQPDPEGYMDSVNLYAAFGHNPVNLRDPTGKILGRAVTGAAKRSRHVPNVHAHSRAALASGGVTVRETEAIDWAAKQFARYKDKAGKAKRVTALDIRVSKDPNKSARRLNLAEESETGPIGKIGQRVTRDAKPGWISDKIPEKEPLTVTLPGRREQDDVTKEFFGDLDVSRLEIDGRLATDLEVRQFTWLANKRFAELWREAGKGGDLVPVPFKHSGHLNLPEIFGKRLYDYSSLDQSRAFLSKVVDNEFLAKLGHPGESLTMRWTRGGNLIAYKTPREVTQRWIRHTDALLKKQQEALYGSGSPKAQGWKSVDELIEWSKGKGLKMGDKWLE